MLKSVGHECCHTTLIDNDTRQGESTIAGYMPLITVAQMLEDSGSDVKVGILFFSSTC